MNLMKQNDTTKVIPIFMADSSSPTIGKTGLTLTVTLSKNGAAFAAAIGTVTELGNGNYYLTPTSADTGTLGPLIVRATGTGAVDFNTVKQVVAFDPYVSSLGLSLAKTTNITGFNDIAATDVVSSGAITTNAGAVSTVTTVGTTTTLTNLPVATTDWLTATAVKSDAVTKIQSGLALANQIPSNFTAATFVSAGVFATAALANAPTGGSAPTAVAIRQEIDANSTQLAAIKLTTDKFQFSTPSGGSLTGNFVKSDMWGGNGVVITPVNSGNPIPSTLVASGLDSIVIETGVNARQALSPILAACAGVLVGAGTGTIIIKGGNVSATRITASTDIAGNRTSTTLSLPI